MNTGRCLPVSIAAYFLTASLAFAQVGLNCPVASLPANMDSYTEDCLNDLDEVLSLDSQPRKTRNGLLWRHDRADQTLVIAVMYSRYCRLLEEHATNQSRSEMASWLERVHDELYEKEVLSRIISDSRDTASLPIHIGPARAFRVRATGQFITVASRKDANAPPPQPAGRMTSTSRSELYLRDSPYVVNNNNKYFVLVASVFSASDAAREIDRLKSKAPQYDFVAYAPYQGNPAYAIMMATWVSKEVAYQALEEARRDVAGDAFVWKCPQSGEIGTC